MLVGQPSLCAVVRGLVLPATIVVVALQPFWVVAMLPLPLPLPPPLLPSPESDYGPPAWTRWTLKGVRSLLSPPWVPSGHSLRKGAMTRAWRSCCTASACPHLWLV